MHTSSNVVELYLSRRAGGKGLISVEECVKKETKSLYDYAKGNKEWMTQAALKEKVLLEEENAKDYQKRKQEEKIRKWKDKPLK